jgi:2-polyprenyl-3-methyl-5-hydroxy-6-metoxy-1,4-benzoquinol methylase
MQARERFTRTECVICGGAVLRPVPGFDRVHMVRCGRCKARFAGVSPSDAELEGHYRGYGNWPDSEITRVRYRELLGAFESYRQNNRIFDMGCGAGYFLEEAQAMGWSPHGSNIGERAITMCREKGLDVVEAPVAQDAFPDAHFDVATAFEVFEHLRDPGPEAQTLARLVRPGGLLYCTTPNFDSLSRRVLGQSWRVIDYPEHLVYFTAASLSVWLQRYGFIPLSVKSSGISPTELRGALGRRRQSDREPTGVAEPDMDARLRSATESGRLMPVLKRGVNYALGAAGAGDTLKGWFVRVSDG